MIYLKPVSEAAVLEDIVHGIDTFWTWAIRDLKEVDQLTFSLPDEIKPKDLVLQYSLVGRPKFPTNTVALLWETYPELKRNQAYWPQHPTMFDPTIATINECAQHAARRVVASPIMVEFYEQFGPVEYLPLGVDANLFKPMPDKESLRRKYDVPLDRRVFFWCGTVHPWKGYDKLRQYAALNPDIFFILAWRDEHVAEPMPGALNTFRRTQAEIAELMNCADRFLCCGRSRPYYLAEWEAMACNLRPVILDDWQKDFIPCMNPRDDIFRLKWDRHGTKEVWSYYLRSLIG